jgi:hypothetical protein
MYDAKIKKLNALRSILQALININFANPRRFLLLIPIVKNKEHMMKRVLIYLGFIFPSVATFATLPIIESEVSYMEESKLLPAAHPACIEATTSTTTPIKCSEGNI